MAPTPHRIAQTSTELKKSYKKSGPQLPQRQQKQLERGYELDVRASRVREAEDRRRIATKKRKEREEKEKAARKQIGVGLATQLIGYSHTQAQLKNGMEAFLGVKQRKEEEKRKRELELTKKLEAIAQTVEKEPWDDDDSDDIPLDLPEISVDNKEQHYVDDDLDDDSLLEAHDMVTSDPVEPPSPAVKPPPLPLPAPLIAQNHPESPAKKEDLDFVRLHGPINKAIESVLDQLPDPLIELLSQDISLRLPGWDPAPGLLHKLNPLGLPPHRLRVKVGSVIVLLRDLNTSSQLSKSQHLRILRAENDRLECLVLDGQLEGTKAFLTRVPFNARYRNEDNFPFQRTQFPVRVATEYKSLTVPRETSQSSFKVPSLLGKSNSLSSSNRPNPSFKRPGRPASKSAPLENSKALKAFPLALNKTLDLDEWDDFLESGTQIARELSGDPVFPKAIPAAVFSVDALPPFSTQDLDFSMDDLDEVPPPAAVTMTSVSTAKTTLAPFQTSNITQTMAPAWKTTNPADPTPPRQIPNNALLKSTKPLPRRQNDANPSPLSDLTNLRPSQKPPSASDRPGLKRKGWVPEKRMPPTKRQSLPSSKPAMATTIANITPSLFEDFIISTQDAASFFVDDDELSLGSPPIAV